MNATKKIEFGDFQTPDSLAREVCRLVRDAGVRPQAILEPTCGRGSFLQAAAETFTDARLLVGIEINETYLDEARRRLTHEGGQTSQLIHADFFTYDFETLLQGLDDPILIVGNPPWVTNSQLGELGGSNLPTKRNFRSQRGIEAITGKSNFDISEWMLIRLLDLVKARRAVIAVLCKTAVARKVLLHAWKSGQTTVQADLHRIDASEHFDASVDSCLLFLQIGPLGRSTSCGIHADLKHEPAARRFGHLDGRLISDLDAYERLSFLSGGGPHVWRSGIKHDCAKVMEFTRRGGDLVNGHDETASLEDSLVFPMLKSSNVASNSTRGSSRWMLVTQRNAADDTRMLQTIAPLAWRYLMDHAVALDKRASSIYKKRARFAMFGIGSYTFAPWKVAISGFYKKLHFAVVGPIEGKPVVLDDTCYFLSCDSEDEANKLVRVLNSELAKEFLTSLIFWDAKRPINVEILQQLNIAQLASELGVTLPASARALGGVSAQESIRLV